MIQDAFTQSDYAINITDSEGVLLLVNDAYLRLYKFDSREQVIGSTQRIIRSPLTPNGVYQEMWRTIKAGGTWRGDLTNVAQDGNDVYIHLTISPIRRDGKLAGFMGFSMDRTQLIQMENQLLQANKLTTLGTLGAGLAHELNNPLAAVLLDAEYLKTFLDGLPGTPSNQSARAAADSVLRGVERVRTVLKHFLEYSKQDPAHVSSRFPVSDLLRQCLLLVSGQLSGNGIQVNLHGGEGVYLRGNQTMLESVLHNLLANSRDAFKERSEGSKRIGITVKPPTPEGRVCIEYRDNAGGIAAEHLDRIFEPFFTTKGAHGTGLGLAICRKILRQHGGEIECESHGEETLFRIHVHASVLEGGKTNRLQDWEKRSS